MNSNDPILQVENLNISFVNKKGENRIIVENGNFVVYPGEIVLIVGENGSGKSSIFRSIVSDFDNDEISIGNLIFKLKNKFKKNKFKLENSKKLIFNGIEICDSNSLDYLRKSVGFSRQEDDYDSFFERNVWNYVLDYISASEGCQNLSYSELNEMAQSVYDSLDCEKYCDGNLKKVKLKNASGGERKIASILAALSRKKAKLFILDEPINNLDAYHARKLNNYLVDLKNSEYKPGILIITHCPMFLDVDRVYNLKKGKLVLMDKDKYEIKSCYGLCDKSSKKYIEEE